MAESMLEKINQSKKKSSSNRGNKNCKKCEHEHK